MERTGVLLLVLMVAATIFGSYRAFRFGKGAGRLLGLIPVAFLLFGIFAFLSASVFAFQSRSDSDDQVGDLLTAAALACLPLSGLIGTVWAFVFRPRPAASSSEREGV
jgi:hypothetical protein